MEILEGMLQKDKDNFGRICNRLLGTCFLCKGNQNTRSDYYFVLKYRKEFKEYLGILGYRLEINEDYGVIQLTSPKGYNRMNLKLYDSIVLLILRILYDEKKRELSAIEEVIVNLGDIQDKFLSLKIRDKIIDKTTMRNALNLFRRYQIVELLDKDMGDKESCILIYDSILMAVRADDIKAAYEKLETYRKGKNTNDEETDEDEADQLAQI